MNINRIYLAFILLCLFACTEPAEPLWAYEDLDRTVGPEGGILRFYEGGLPGEKGYNNSKALITLDIPAGALQEPVTFSLRERFYNHFGTYEVLPKEVDFKIPVVLTMTYGMSQSDFNNTADICFYQPFFIPFDADFYEAASDRSQWQEVENYELDDENLQFSVEVTDLKNLYFYERSNYDDDYVICNQTNDNIEIKLGGENNVLIIPPGAALGNTGINLSPIDLPEPVDYPQPTLDEYVVLATTGAYQSISSNNMDLQEPALLFLQASKEQAGDVWLDWNLANDKIKILRIDPADLSILEVLDYHPDISQPDHQLFGAKVDRLGTYVLALPKADFKLRLGGWVRITASGGTSLVQEIEHYDYGGAFIYWLDAHYELNVNNGKDETAGYYLCKVAFGNEMENREFPAFQSDSFVFKYYDSDDSTRWVRYRSFGANITYSLVDKEGGWVEGTINGKTPQSAYNESGSNVQLDIEFRFRIAQWEEI